jgi:hypothetical protein
VPSLFNFVLKYIIKKIQQSEGGLELNGAQHLLVADYVKLLDENISTININKDSIRS